MTKSKKFKSIWNAIESNPKDVISQQAKSKLMMAIDEYIKVHNLTQLEASKLLGVTQPRISDLLRGKINLFSLDTLMDMAAVIGLEPQININNDVLAVA